MGGRTVEWWASVSSGWSPGMGLFVLTTGTDLLTTLVGLRVVEGLHEQNPVGAWLYGEFGAVGLVGLAVGSVVCVVGVVEWAAAWLDSRPDAPISGRQLSLASYGPLVFVSTVVTVQNAMLVIRVL